MKKKQVVVILAIVVSLCCLVCLVSAIVSIWGALQTGESVPIGMAFLALVTGLCAFMIWKGAIEMD